MAGRSKLSTNSFDDGDDDDQTAEISFDIPYRPSERSYYTIGSVTTLVLLAIILTALGISGNLSGQPSAALRASSPSVASEVASPPEVSYIDVVETINDETWPDIQKALCPAGRPDPDRYGPILFQLAREQLDITPQDFEQAKKMQKSFAQPRPDAELTHRFFHGQFQKAVYVADEQVGNVAYIPIWKGGNIAIRRWMRTKLANNNETIFFEVSTEELFQEPLPACVVTAVRDPIEHFLSGYNEIEFRRKTWQETRGVMPAYMDLPYETSAQRIDRFTKFVLELVLEDSIALRGPIVSHVFSMTRILAELNRVGGYLTAYLPTLSDLNSKFPAFVKETCQLSQELPTIPAHAGKHVSSEDREGFYQAAKDVWDDKGSIAKALCALHAMDYACWKDLHDGIPLVCQEVYSSAQFYEAIMG